MGNSKSPATEQSFSSTGNIWLPKGWLGGGGVKGTFLGIFLTKKQEKNCYPSIFSPEMPGLYQRTTPLLSFWPLQTCERNAELIFTLNWTLFLTLLYCAASQKYFFFWFPAWNFELRAITGLGLGRARRRSAAQEAAMPSHLRINLGHLSKSPHASAPQARLHSTSTSCSTSPHASTNQAS